MGIIVAAHCSCMAGLGEACSHVAALMFAIECVVRWAKQETCTSKPCSWAVPSCSKVEYAECTDINFNTPASKYKALKECHELPQKRRPQHHIQPLSPEEREWFLTSLKETGVKCAFMSVVPGYNDDYVPAGVELPKPLTTLYDERYKSLSKDEIVLKAHEVYASTKLKQQEVSTFSCKL